MDFTAIFKSAEGAVRFYTDIQELMDTESDYELASIVDLTSAVVHTYDNTGSLRSTVRIIEGETTI